MNNENTSLTRRPLTAALALAFAASGATSAYAQSSVTLYGIVDAGLAYVHNAQGANGQNQSTLAKLSSGNLSGSRWGLRGNEDLGNGFAAIFQLENGFNVGTGALGRVAANSAARRSSASPAQRGARLRSAVSTIRSSISCSRSPRTVRSAACSARPATSTTTTTACA
jgi:hypothetical protein